MENSKRKISKALLGLLIASGVVLLLFGLAFLLYALLANGLGDNDLYSFGGVIKYHLKGMLDLFVFKYANPSNIAYFALSCFLYALIICWVIFLVAGIIIADKKGRKVIWWSILLTFINLCVYLVLASGSHKFIRIINHWDAFANSSRLMLPVVLMIAFGGLYFFLSLIAYFWTIIESFIKPDLLRGDYDYAEYFSSDERIRQIVKEELLNIQPLKVVIVGNETKEEPQPVEEVKEEPVVVEEPVKEEPVVVEETQSEPVKEEPKKVIFGTIDFWQVARTVWPQLDNPKPLKKEEAPRVEHEQPQEEGDSLDDINRKARLPFITRILKAESDTKVNYNELKNEILSYGVKSRLSKSGDVFRLHGQKYAKIFLVGKTLKVYLALNPEDYKDSTIPVEDVGHRPAYAEIPLLFKVRSDLSVRRCKELIKAAMEKAGFTQKEVKDTNWVSELRKINAEKAKNK